MSDYRVLVTGSRTWDDHFEVWSALSGILAEHEPLTVVHGAAREGADRHAQNWALSLRHASNRFVTPEPHPAAWRTPDGRRDISAGYRRNAEMVDAGADECLAFLMPCRLGICAGKPEHPTHGAGHCADLAEKAGIPVRRFTPPEPSGSFLSQKEKDQR